MTNHPLGSLDEGNFSCFTQSSVLVWLDLNPLQPCLLEFKYTNCIKVQCLSGFSMSSLVSCYEFPGVFGEVRGRMDTPTSPVDCRQRVTLFGEPRWLRALALHPSPVLFADVEPADACQGRVGNCWLIAALSALAEFPAYFKNKIFITKKAGTKNAGKW